MKLTKNEIRILKMLLDNGRVSDSTMAKNLRISTQAIGKLRKKLEDNGVIENYSCNLNYEKIGLNVFTMSLIRLKEKFWKNSDMVTAMEGIKKIPAFCSCMSPNHDTLIILQGFRDIKERDIFFGLLKRKYYECYDIIQSFSFSSINLMTKNPKELFKLILDGKPIEPIS